MRGRSSSPRTTSSTSAAGSNARSEPMTAWCRAATRSFRLENGRFVVEDLGSANGTHLNNVRVQKQALGHSDVVQCGSLVMRFVDEGGVNIVPQQIAQAAARRQRRRAARWSSIAAAIAVATIAPVSRWAQGFPPPQPMGAYKGSRRQAADGAGPNAAGPPPGMAPWRRSPVQPNMPHTAVRRRCNAAPSQPRSSIRRRSRASTRAGALFGQSRGGFGGSAAGAQGFNSPPVARRAVMARAARGMPAPAAQHAVRRSARDAGWWRWRTRIQPAPNRCRMAVRAGDAGG